MEFQHFWGAEGAIFEHFLPKTFPWDRPLSGSFPGSVFGPFLDQKGSKFAPEIGPGGGPSTPKIEPGIGPQNGAKMEQKRTPKWSQKWTKMSSGGSDRPGPGPPFWTLGPSSGPFRPQERFGAPKWTKTDQNGPQNDLKWAELDQNGF